MNRIQIVVLMLAGLAAASAVAAAESPQPRPLALDAAESYRAAARYPEWTRVLMPGQADPIVLKRTPTRQVLPGRQESGRQLAVWASTLAAEAGQAVDLYASIESIAPRKLVDALSRQKAATIGARLVDESGQQLAVLDYADDGQGADRLRGDGVYSARYVLDAKAAPALGTAKSLKVDVTALAGDGERFAAVGGFQFSNPGARLAGVFADSVRDGNLVLTTRVQVLTAGRYHVAATLADMAGQPVAEAQAARQLEAGTQDLELAFYGLAFRDRGVTGPLRVASITLTSASSMPNALGPVLHDVALLPMRPLSAFTDRAFGRPDLLDAAQRLEQQAPPLVGN